MLGPTALARRATRDIPIVFGFSGDPVEVGLVQNFSRPGGNLSGIYLLTLDLVGKRFELLKELVPGRESAAAGRSPRCWPFRRETTGGPAASTSWGGATSLAGFQVSTTGRFWASTEGSLCLTQSRETDGFNHDTQIRPGST